MARVSGSAGTMRGHAMHMMMLRTSRWCTDDAREVNTMRSRFGRRQRTEQHQYVSRYHETVRERLYISLCIQSTRSGRKLRKVSCMAPKHHTAPRDSTTWSEVDLTSPSICETHPAPALQPPCILTGGGWQWGQEITTDDAFQMVIWAKWLMQRPKSTAGHGDWISRWGRCDSCCQLDNSRRLWRFFCWNWPSIETNASRCR